MAKTKELKKSPFMGQRYDEKAKQHNDRFGKSRLAHERLFLSAPFYDL